MTSPKDISIGELSKRTGISVLRLRAWESRYGFPTANVLESGHRRYEQAVVNRTALVAQLLEKGHRVGKVIHLDNEEMLNKIEESRSTVEHFIETEQFSFLEVFNSVLDYDEAKFTSFWENARKQMGILEFLETAVYPFMVELGEKWENGVIGVSHEHFASNLLEYILEHAWREENLKLEGSSTVLALLPNEYHSFGLHFAASLCVFNRNKVIYLGARTPLDAILETVNKNESRRLIISVSETYDISIAEKYLKILLSKLDASIEFWVGGTATPDIEGIIKITSLAELNQLLGRDE